MKLDNIRKILSDEEVNIIHTALITLRYKNEEMIKIFKDQNNKDAKYLLEKYENEQKIINKLIKIKKDQN